MKVHEAPGILPSIIARAMPLNSGESESESNNQTKNKDVLPASAETKEDQPWADLIPSFLK